MMENWRTVKKIKEKGKKIKRKNEHSTVRSKNQILKNK